MPNNAAVLLWTRISGLPDFSKIWAAAVDENCALSLLNCYLADRCVVFSTLYYEFLA